MFLVGPHAASPLVHRYNFVGVYPTSDTGWNTVRPPPARSTNRRSSPAARRCAQDGDRTGDECKWDDFDCKKDNNDVAFVSEIAALLASKGSIGRLYAYGVRAARLPSPSCRSC